MSVNGVKYGFSLTTNTESQNKNDFITLDDKPVKISGNLDKDGTGIGTCTFTDGRECWGRFVEWKLTEGEITGSSEDETDEQFWEKKGKFEGGELKSGKISYWLDDGVLRKEMPWKEMEGNFSKDLLNGKGKLTVRTDDSKVEITFGNFNNGELVGDYEKITGQEWKLFAMDKIQLPKEGIEGKVFCKEGEVVVALKDQRVVIYQPLVSHRGLHGIIDKSGKVHHHYNEINGTIMLVREPLFKKPNPGNKV